MVAAAYQRADHAQPRTLHAWPSHSDAHELLSIITPTSILNVAVASHGPLTA